MLWWFAQTTLIAGGLAVVATLAGRLKRFGPEARHALWLVVLIKFAIPPFVAWPWSVPDAWSIARVEPAPVALPVVEVASTPAEFLTPPQVKPPVVVSLPPSPEEVLAASESIEPLPLPAEDPRMPMIPEEKPIEARSEVPAPAIAKPETWNPASILLALWLAGSVVVMARRGFTVIRFHRALAGHGSAPEWLVEEARAIGERMGVEVPPIVAAPGMGTPLLWCLGRPRLILPEALIKRLDGDRWPGILAHELAHLARRDHWVVRLELLVEVAWWWNPLFWHARRRLHEEAELACDARVIRALPERRHAYAEALVDVCEHLARVAIPSPALGVGGAGASRSLEGRLLMILQDPISRRPPRQLALAALLLAALALPAWTLGQQPDKPKAEVPPTKPEAAVPVSSPEQEPAAEPSKPAPATIPAPEGQQQFLKKFAPPIAGLTIDDVRASFARRKESLKNLAMRYVVTSRSKSPEQIGWRRVQVEVADVVYGFQPGTIPGGNWVVGSRLDVLQAITGSASKPGEAPADAGWLRRLEIRSGGELKSLRVDPKRNGQALFRAGMEPQPSLLNSVGSYFTGDNSLLVGNTGATRSALSRADHRPLISLDLDGFSPSLLGGVGVQLNGFAVDGVGGQEAVRLAWTSLGSGDARGLCWLAPGLDFAVIREDVSIDDSHGSFNPAKRWLWRKEAGDFTRVGDIWLPGKVRTTLHEVAPDGQSQAVREQVVTLEDYRVNAEPAKGTFLIESPIQGLDDKTGDFIVLAPEPVPALVARLERAVKESPFGSPLDEKTGDPTAEERKQAAAVPFAVVMPAPVGPAPKQAIAVPPPAKNAAKADPGIISRPATNFDDPIPAAEPRADDPALVKNPAVQAELERRFKLDPEVKELASQMKAANEKLEEAQRVSQSGDPAERLAKKKLESLKAKYDQLWETKSRAIREELGPVMAEARDQVVLLQIRVARKAAEVKKAEAQRKLALNVVTRNRDLLKKNPNFVSNEEVNKAEGELGVADAELEGKKTELDEAQLFLEQARRRLGPAEAPNTTPQVENSPASTLPEFRETVEMMEAQLEGKKAELRGAEIQEKQAKIQLDRLKKAGHQDASEMIIDARSVLGTATAELDRKKAEVLESELRVKQARRRAEVEEARLKREVTRVKDRLQWSEGMAKKGYVSKATLEADRASYNDLMLQLDPKYVPAVPSTEGPTSLDIQPQSEVPAPLDEKTGKVEPAIKPVLAITLTGEATRLAGQNIPYKLFVTNPGTTQARKVKVTATLPREGGKLITLPPGATLNTQSRKLHWDIAQIEPGQAVALVFDYATSTPGLYKATVEVASGEFRAIDTMTTDVFGNTVLDLQVTQTSGLIDVGKTNLYDITIKNSGTKDATRLLLKGSLAKNLKVVKNFNVEKGKFLFNLETGDFAFPEIERLAVGQSITVSLEVQAEKSGPADCHVFLSHAEMDPQSPQIEDVITTTVTGVSREPASK